MMAVLLVPSDFYQLNVVRIGRAMLSACRRCPSVMMPFRESSSSYQYRLAASLARSSIGSTAATPSSSSLLPFPPARRALSTSLNVRREDSPAPPRRQVDSERSPPPGTDSATSKAERTLRRFWDKVDLAYYPSSSPTSSPPYPHLRIRLDGRSLKTPSGTLLAIPADRPLLASLVAREWAEQEKILKVHSLPMTSLAARAIDGLGDNKIREGVCDELIKYLETETICFHESHPPVLVQLQKERWDPILSWTSETFHLPTLRTFDSILGVEQDAKVVSALRQHISSYDAWDLAAFERVVRTSKSFLVSLRLMESIKQNKEFEFGVSQAAEAAEVEVESQTQRWGQVEDTHDVDHADLRKTLASVACAIVKDNTDMAKEVANEVITS